MRDKAQRARLALLTALETMAVTGSKRPDWLLDLWRLYYTKGWRDGHTQAQVGAGADARTSPLPHRTTESAGEREMGAHLGNHTEQEVAR